MEKLSGKFGFVQIVRILLKMAVIRKKVEEAFCQYVKGNLKGFAQILLDLGATQQHHLIKQEIAHQIKKLQEVEEEIANEEENRIKEFSENFSIVEKK